MTAVGRSWPTFAAMLKYYLTEGFLYVESRCTDCGMTQRVLVFPESKVVECKNCSRMTSEVKTLIDHG